MILSSCQGTGRAKHGLHRTKLRSVSGEVRLEGEGWDESRENDQSSLDRTELRLREELLLRLLGFYYHPRLLDFDLRARLGLEQTEIESSQDSPDRSVDGDNASLEGRVRLFKEHPYSAELYSSRQETRTRQILFETTEAVITESGVNLNAKDWAVPTRFNYNDYTYRGRGADRFREDRETLLLEGRRQGESDFYQYTLEHNDVTLEPAQEFDDLSLYATSTHLFSKERGSRLQNGVRWREQAGTINSENRGVSSSYRHGWTERLSSNHTLQYGYSSTSGNASESLNVSSGVAHQLYSSLSTALDGRVGTVSFEGGNVDSVGGTAQFNYQKQSPVGKITLRHVTDAYLQDQEALQGLVPIVDEPQVNDVGIPIFLGNANVDHATVVVTDDLGLTVYTEGPDYVLVRVDARTRVDIPLGSLIGPGQTILVDYIYAPVPDQRFRSVSHTSGAGLRVPGVLDVDVGYGTVDQELLDGLPSATLSDSRRRTANLRVYPYGATLGVDYEDFDSDLTPYERVRYYGSVVHPFQRTGSMNLTVGTFKTRFKGEAERERGTTVSAGLMTSLGRQATGEVRAEFRDIDFRSDEGWGYLLELGLTYRVQALTFTVDLRYSEEEFEVADDQRLVSLLFTLSRRF